MGPRVAEEADGVAISELTSSKFPTFTTAPSDAETPIAPPRAAERTVSPELPNLSDDPSDVNSL
jgi:hypothetical protein